MSQLSTRVRNVYRLMLILLCAGVPSFTFGQATAPDDFGQNRIQYKRFNWQYYSTQNFNVYYAQGGIELARHAAEHAEKELKRITSLIGYYPYSKITLIVYNSVSDLKQSNIGLIDDPYKGGNDVLFVKSKIEIPFQGSQTEFKREITYRVSELLLSDMMYGGSLKEVIQSNYLLRLPEWFVSGAAAYISEGWSVEMDNYVRDMLQKTGGKRSEPLFARNQKRTGQAIWNYIAEKHGASAIQNILNLTRITRDIEIGIASSLNMPYKRFMRDWFAYYNQMNTFAEGELPAPDKEKKIKKITSPNDFYSEPVLSPNGQQMAFVIYDRGSYKVVIRDLKREKQKTIYKGGFKMPNQEQDHTVPLLSWRSENQIGITDYKKGKLQLKLQAADSRYWPAVETVKGWLGKSRGVLPLGAYSQVTGFDYSADGQFLVLSAVKNGQSDLFLYRGNRLVQQLTNDIYDDLQPSFLPGSNRLVFSSNRLQDSLQSAQGKFSQVANNYDIYLYDPENRQSRFWQLTYTPANEVQPVGLSADEIMYIGEETGIRTLYRHNTQTGEISRVTDFRQNIKDYDYHLGTGNLVFIALDRAKEYAYYYPNFPLTTFSAFKTKRQEVLEGHLAKRVEQERARVAAALAAKAKADSMAALAPVASPGQQITTDSAAAKTAVAAAAPKPRTILAMPAADTLALNKPRPYDLRFGVNNLITSIYADPLLGFGFVMEVGMADLFEDYRIRGGVFALTDLQTTNFYAEYSNLKNRYDYRVGYQKQSVYMVDGPAVRRLGKHEILPAFSYPLTNALSVKVLPRYSNIRYTFIENFTEPDIVMDFAGIGGELVYDNSVVTGMNMREGTRMKVGVTRMYGIGKKENGFGKFYVDLRHYQKIHKEFVWANRVSYGHSFGPSPKKYLVGGVDNWINASEDSVQIPEGGATPDDVISQFFYMEFATPLRGFNYNARNGTRYVMWNSELRLPLFQYLFEGPINSGFFRNFQLVGFFDAGTAYNTGNPFSEDNSVNTQPVPQPPFEIIVRNFRNPLMYGYGWGARTTLLGIYGRFDMAWGEKDLVKVGPKFYFSMGYDF
ncbi:BamA/TamA family outer membrane protein [Rufibacter quisquiliarum]|uniref:WD40 repeat protein n=1 Tax=Rufibacter quisquiliarum TaxID=1549639 RepID=A0A839GDK1_9BACT|nr:BamA/TamA family outer membrane protein [Rufibacter quisquiliarum]MBA9076490.1 WD40 repeat protein [Rufibacter quisquiliarum]